MAAVIPGHGLCALVAATGTEGYSTGESEAEIIGDSENILLVKYRSHVDSRDNRTELYRLERIA